VKTLAFAEPVHVLLVENSEIGIMVLLAPGEIRTEPVAFPSLKRAERVIQEGDLMSWRIPPSEAVPVQVPSDVVSFMTRRT